MRRTSSQEQWLETLAVLKSQLTKATFETHLKSTRFLRREGDCFVIDVHAPNSVTLLEVRLRPKIEKALRRVTDTQTVTVAFEVQAPPRESDETIVEVVPHPPPAPQPTTGTGRDADLTYAINFHQLWHKGGFGQVPHYVSEFWIPYLKPNTFALWKYLDSLDKRDIRHPENRWTPPTAHYQTHLAHQLGRSGRRVIAGGLIECSRSKHARLSGEPVSQCCGLHPVHLHKTDPHPGGQRCYYWGEGALEVLYREKLLALAIDRRAKTSSRPMRLQVWRLFPILTPKQVATLNPHLQDAHQRWLRNHQGALGITVSEWVEIEAKTLVPLMTGYEDYRVLFGHYQFNRILAAQREGLRG